jgi:signal transduction histidine kinase
VSLKRPDLSVGGWLALGVAAAAGVLVLVGGSSWAGLERISREVALQNDRIHPRTDASASLHRSILRLAIAARSQAMAPSPARERAAFDADQATGQALAVLDRLPKEPDGAELYERIPALVAEYRERARALARVHGDEIAAVEARCRAVREELVPILEAYAALQDRKLHASDRAMGRLRDDALRLLLVGGGVALLVVAATSWLVARAIRRPVRELVGLSRRVAQGDYAGAASLPSTAGAAPRNELAELTEVFGEMARELEERELRIAAQNEELQAQNEELQSQREELQAQNEELRSQADELRRTEDALREADRRKDEFLAVLSHELRNPLAPIVNSLAILTQAPPGSDPARRAREIVQRQVKQLVRLVDDLLDVTRIARGKIELRLGDADLAGIVRHVVDDHRSLLEDAGVRLELALPEAPLPASADPERIAQVVANLVQNAGKFTRRGGSVRVSCATEGPSAVLRVTDDGEGISPELLGRLFVPFVQADGSLARTRGGLGLGLALVKGIVELHGGSVRAASDGPGRGAEFTVELPLAAALQAAAAPTTRG